MTQVEIQKAINTVTCQVEEITPELAKLYLEMNRENRAISKRSIASYVMELIDGTWCCNGESIIFDEDGKLCNGQHRMLAIIKSGQSVASVVVRGVDRDTFPTLDQGKKRTLAQIFGLNKLIKVSGGLLASVLRVCYVYKEYRRFNDKMDINFTPTLAESLRLEYNGIEDSVAYAQNCKSPLITKTLIGSLHYIFTLIDPIDCDVFLNALLNGDCRHHTELLKLRNYFLDIKMNEKTKKLMSDKTFVGGVIIKSWNAWREGRILRDIEYKKGEEFPQAI